MGSQALDKSEADPSSPAWQKYYEDASRKRRQRRKLGQHSFPHDERKRRRKVETILMVGSMIVLGVLRETAGLKD